MTATKFNQEYEKSPPCLYYHPLSYLGSIPQLAVHYFGPGNQQNTTEILLNACLDTEKTYACFGRKHVLAYLDS